MSRTGYPLALYFTTFYAAKSIAYRRYGEKFTKSADFFELLYLFFRRFSINP